MVFLTALVVGMIANIVTGLFSKKVTTPSFEQPKQPTPTKADELIKQWRDGIEGIKDSEWYHHSMDSTVFRDKT